MAIKIETARRFFRYNGTTLEDPTPAMTPEQVKEFYALTYPELLTAEIEGPVTSKRGLTFEFRRAVGTKGGSLSELSREQLRNIALGASNDAHGGSILSVDEGTTLCSEIFYRVAKNSLEQRSGKRLATPWTFLPFLP